MDDLVSPITEGYFDNLVEEQEYIVGIVSLSRYKVDSDLLNYLVSISLESTVKPWFFKGFNEALILMTLTKRKCCLLLCLSPLISKCSLFKHICYIAIYGVEAFLTNIQTEMSYSLRERKLKKLLI